MVLPHPNSPLGGVRAVYVWQCILEGSLLQLDEVLYILQCDIVHLVYKGFEATAGQVFVCQLVGSKKFLFGSIFDGDMKYALVGERIEG